MINSKIRGSITIKDLEPSLISTFPHVSIRLSEVIVRDSLWNKYHHDLVNADRLYLRLSLASIFSGSPEVSKIIAENSRFYLFSDSTGYSNDYIFKGNNTGDSSKGKKPLRIPEIELKDVSVVIDFQHRNKLYDFDVHKLNCNIREKDNKLLLDIKTDLIVHSLAFNRDNGSFVHEKPLEGKFRLEIGKESRILAFNNIKLNIDNQPFFLSGFFNLSSPPPLYKLTIKTNNVDFKKASSLVSDNIRVKLDSFKVKGPIDVIAVLDGSRRPNRNPYVNITAVTKNNDITAAFGHFTDASFTGRFTNQYSLAEPRSDANSALIFYSFSGAWEGLPLRSDTARVTNLTTPVLEADVKGEFAMTDLNELLGANSIEFTRGNGIVDLKFRMPLMSQDTTTASAYGDMSFKNAVIQYIPRKISLNDCSGKIAFEGDDVYVRQLKAESGKTHLVMNGGIRNFMSLIDRSPEKILLNWSIASPHLNLADFTTFLQKRTSRTAPISTRRKFVRMSQQLDKMLQDCSVQLQLNAEKLSYKKFNATNVTANLTLNERIIALRNVNVQHGGGTLMLSGSLKQEEGYNALAFNSSLNNVNVEQVFTSFNNFGQDGIMDKNIRGLLTAKMNITAAITESADILSNSLKGIITISLKNGRLIDFEPVEKISETAFKKRDFSDIRFAELKDKLEVNGSEIKINRMEIQSSVLTMFVEGIYDVKKGTDLSIQVPLSNLKKRDEDLVLENKGVESKTGISLRLRAKTGEDGKAKISWDPFKSALRNKDKDADTTAVAKVDVVRNDDKKPASDTLTIVKKKEDRAVADSLEANRKKPVKLPADTTNVNKADTTTKKNIP
jgi:hypothetical protein